MLCNDLEKEAQRLAETLRHPRRVAVGIISLRILSNMSVSISMSKACKVRTLVILPTQVLGFAEGVYNVHVTRCSVEMRVPVHEVVAYANLSINCRGVKHHCEETIRSSSASGLPIRTSIDAMLVIYLLSNESSGGQYVLV